MKKYVSAWSFETVLCETSIWRENSPKQPEETYIHNKTMHTSMWPNHLWTWLCIKLRSGPTACVQTCSLKTNIDLKIFICATSHTHFRHVARYGRNWMFSVLLVCIILFRSGLDENKQSESQSQRWRRLKKKLMEFYLRGTTLYYNFKPWFNTTKSHYSGDRLQVITASYPR